MAEQEQQLERAKFMAKALAALVIPISLKLGVKMPDLAGGTATQAEITKWLADLAVAVQAATERTAGAEDVRSAWLVPGANKRYHWQQQKRLQREWPMLHRAITRLIEGYT